MLKPHAFAGDPKKPLHQLFVDTTAFFTYCINMSFYSFIFHSNAFTPSFSPKFSPTFTTGLPVSLKASA